MTYDVILVGAGHNALFAAALLARAGRSVLVVERADAPGGCLRSDAVTVPGLEHDLFSTNQNLLLASAAYAELKDDLARHGVAFATSERPFAAAFPDGTALRVYQDFARTVEALRAHDARDADGFVRLHERWDDFKRTLLPLLAAPLPSAKAAGILAKAAVTLGPARLIELAQLLVGSTRELGDTYFATDHAKALVAPWGMHLDFGPDVSAGAMFPFVETFSAVENGLSIVEGGAQRLVEGLVAIVEEHGGEVRTGATVDRVLTEGDEAVGVLLSTGERIGAEDAVLAGVTPTALYGRLLREHPLPDEIRRKTDAYRYGPATMMLHLALDGPLRWTAGDDLATFAYVHLAPSVDVLAQTYADSLAGRLPETPLVIVGQTSAVDPTRAGDDAPPGAHALWVQVRTLPSEIVGDAAGEIDATTWEEAAGPYADRVLGIIEQHAPGARAQVIGRRVFSPADLERMNPNLVGGDSVAGSHHLRQNFVFRPFPGASTYTTPVKRLLHIGASVWPGAGNNAASGYHAAQLVMKQEHPLGTLAAAVGATALGAWLARRVSRDA